MRLWTVHPKYLDARGLCALWRESLLAQAVLRGSTEGYRSHPQLTRFRAHADPVRAICSYLLGVHTESLVRGYSFNLTKIDDTSADVCLSETEGQLLWEWKHLRDKLRARAPKLYASIAGLEQPLPHPMFTIVSGSVQEWERAAGAPD